MYSFRVNTITNAQRAVKMLKRIGVACKIGRIRNPKKSDGCGYTVDLLSDNIDEIRDYLISNGININGIDVL